MQFKADSRLDINSLQRTKSLFYYVCEFYIYYKYSALKMSTKTPFCNDLIFKKCSLIQPHRNTVIIYNLQNKKESKKTHTNQNSI